MNWDDVRIFLAVARAGQILAAARTLGVNHATVGRRISALEEALQTRLVVRRTNGCELTPEGEVFLNAAERMETEMLAAQAHIGRFDAALAGTVRIGAPDGFGVSFLAPRLGALIARHPALKVQLVPVPRAFSLSQREADIAITIERPAEGRLISGKLTDYTLGIYASRAYLAANGAPADIEALKSHRLIGYVEDLLFTPRLTSPMKSSRAPTRPSRFPRPSGRRRPCAPAPALASCMITLRATTKALSGSCPKSGCAGPTGPSFTKARGNSPVFGPW